MFISWTVNRTLSARTVLVDREADGGRAAGIEAGEMALGVMLASIRVANVECGRRFGNLARRIVGEWWWYWLGGYADVYSDWHWCVRKRRRRDKRRKRRRSAAPQELRAQGPGRDSADKGKELGSRETEKQKERRTE